MPIYPRRTPAGWPMAEHVARRVAEVAAGHNPAGPGRGRVNVWGLTMEHPWQTVRGTWGPGMMSL
jgi:hypothetical protein